MGDPIVDVVFPGFRQPGLLALGQRADEAGRAAGPERPGGNLSSLQDHRAGRDERRFPDDTAAEDGGTNPDQGVISDDGSMHDGSMAQGDSLSDHTGITTVFHVEDGSILDVGIVADFYPFLVTAQDTAIPDRDPFPQADPPVQCDPGRDETGTRNLGSRVQRRPIPMRLGIRDLGGRGEGTGPEGPIALDLVG
jgi:hypothetical protein